MWINLDHNIFAIMQIWNRIRLGCSSFDQVLVRCLPAHVRNTWTTNCQHVTFVYISSLFMGHLQLESSSIHLAQIIRFQDRLLGQYYCTERYYDSTNDCINLGHRKDNQQCEQ